MENLKDSYKASNESDNANNPAHYTTLTLGIVVSMIGVLLRFAGTFAFIDIISNVILVIGVLICLRAVSGILK